LAVSGIISRAALIENPDPAFDSGYPAIVLYGPPGVGKSVIAGWLSEIFGLDRARFYKYLPTLSTPGEVTIRHTSSGEGRESWLWSQPLAFLDEVQDADRPLRLAAMVYAQGERVHMIEGSPVLIRPFALLIYNPQRAREVLPERVERRSAIFDLASLSSRRTELRRRIAQLTRASPWPRLPVREWAAKVNPAYSAEQIEFLAQLEEAVAPSNTSSVIDPVSIWHFSKGYEALLGDWRLAAYWAVHDLALALESRGLAYNNWRERLHAVWEGLPHKPPQQPSFALEEARRAEIERRAEELRKEAEEAKLEELQERLVRAEQLAALKVMVAELERTLRDLPQVAVARMEAELKRRGVVWAQSQWAAPLKDYISKTITEHGWSISIGAVKEMISRRLSEAELEILASKLKAIEREVEAFKAHLSSQIVKQAEGARELALRRKGTAPPALQPHLRTGLPRHSSAFHQPRYTREDVEALERANEELLSPAAPPELIVDPATGRRYWLWPDGRAKPVS
jgi:hypothetical protein